jgi:hypothetical protein
MKNLNFKNTYKDETCEEFDIFENEKYLGYYVKYYNHPITEEKLDNPVFELYYDYSREYEEFLSSVVADSLNECLEYL